MVAIATVGMCRLASCEWRVRSVGGLRCFVTVLIPTVGMEIAALSASELNRGGVDSSREIRP